MRTVFMAPFDPVTEAEIQYLKQYHKKTGKKVYVAVQREGMLNYAVRHRLLKYACMPYRYLRIVHPAKEDLKISFCDDEATVRQGFFYKAAKGIRRYLVENGCYFEEITKAQCIPSRAAHSFAVAHTAEKLAAKHHLDVKICYHSGLLHDITKKMDEAEGRRILQYYRPDWLHVDPAVWHSYTAVIWLKQNMCCYNRKLLQAIEHHTLGDGRSAYDRVLYIADKIEPTRKYDVRKLTELSMRDLKQGTERVLAEAKLYILQKEGKNV